MFKDAHRLALQRGSSLRAEPTASGNRLPNGNFDPAKEGELVHVWELPPKDWQAQKGFTEAILEEKDAAGTANHWFGFTSSAPELTVTASATVALLPGTRGVRLAGRFRVEKLTVDTKQNWTGAFIGGSSGAAHGVGFENCSR